MKAAILAVALLASVTAASAEDKSSGPLGYPGSNWSVLTINPSVISGTPEDDNVLLQGRVEQGIDWKKYGNWTLNTYAALGYSADKNELSYNNKFVPALGVKMTRSFSSGVVDIGVQAVYQNNFRGVTSGPNTDYGVQAYVSYWTGWNLKK
jgi:hypothetical protein